MVQYFLQNGLSFLWSTSFNSEAIGRKHDGTHQDDDVAFLEGICRLRQKKKGEAEAGALYASIKMWSFLEDVSLLSTEKKGDAGAAALYGGKRKCTVLPSWQTDWP